MKKLILILIVFSAYGFAQNAGNANTKGWISDSLHNSTDIIPKSDSQFKVGSDLIRYKAFYGDTVITTHAILGGITVNDDTVKSTGGGGISINGNGGPISINGNGSGGITVRDDSVKINGRDLDSTLTTKLDSSGVEAKNIVPHILVPTVYPAVIYLGADSSYYTYPKSTFLDSIGVSDSLALKAPKASPTFTGTITINGTMESSDSTKTIGSPGFGNQFQSVHTDSVVAPSQLYLYAPVNILQESATLTQSGIVKYDPQIVNVSNSTHTIAITKSYVYVTPTDSTGLTDITNPIDANNDGMILFLRNNGSFDLTIKNTGNIKISSEFTLDSEYDVVELLGINNYWLVVSAINND